MLPAGYQYPPPGAYDQSQAPQQPNYPPAQSFDAQVQQQQHQSAAQGLAQHPYYNQGTPTNQGNGATPGYPNQGPQQGNPFPQSGFVPNTGPPAFSNGPAPTTAFDQYASNGPASIPNVGPAAQLSNQFENLQLSSTPQQTASGGQFLQTGGYPGQQGPGQFSGIPSYPGPAGSLPNASPPQLPGAHPPQNQYGLPQPPQLGAAFPSGGPPPLPGLGGPPGMPPMGGLSGLPPMGGQAPPGGPPSMGGYPNQGYYPPGDAGFQPQAPRQRLDPAHLPNVVQVLDDDRQIHGGFFATGFPTAEYPPLTTTDFYAQDQGNSNPKFVRSTIYAVPVANEFLKSSSLPFAVEFTPFAQLSANEYKPPVIDLGELGPVRCNRCKAYMCPMMEFIDGGRKFKCAFCHTGTSIPDVYFAHLDHTGRRTDIQHRPEQYLGSYEFVATKEYCRHGVAPNQPVFIFFLDISYNSMKNGVVAAFTKALPDILKNLPKDEGQESSTIKVGLVAYDTMMYFYDLNASSANVSVVSELKDVYTPFLEGLVIEADRAEASLRRVLDSIVAEHGDTRTTDVILGPVIQTGLSIFRDLKCAGKMFIFHSHIPNFDAPGRLKVREDRKVLGTDKERPQLLPADDFYTKLGEQCIKDGASVSLYLFPNSSVDLASIAPVITTSGGSIYRYMYFDAERDGDRFVRDLLHDTSRQVGFDIAMRVRTSTGIRPTGFYGNFYMNNTTDIEVGVVNSDYTFVTEIKYDDTLDSKQSAVIQIAVLFTSVGGQRRVRIHNLSLAVTNDYNVLFRLSYPDTLVAFLTRVAEKTIRERNPQDMKTELISRCAQILATYRSKCSASSPLSQLVLPEALKLLPLYSNCILRNDAVHGGSELTVDDRVYLMSMISSLRTDLLLRLLYPQVVDITKPESFDVPLTQNRASIDFLQPTSAYFVENSIFSFIWIGQGVNSEFLKNIFGIESFQHIGEKTRLVELDNPHSHALQAWLRDLTARRPNGLKLFVVKQNDTLESWMRKFLVEDKYANNTSSYVDFLCQVHHEIRTILS